MKRVTAFESYLRGMDQQQRDSLMHELDDQAKNADHTESLRIFIFQSALREVWDESDEPEET
jgi:predicted nucleotidyltransferase component of viral defense system